CDDVALDPGEPRLDLVEPGRVSRSEVQVDIGCRSKNSVTCLVLCADRLSAITWISLAAGWLTTMSARKATNSAEVCRAAVLPSTSPVLVLNAAYRDNVPCRCYSKPCRSARPGDSGRTGSLRSSAWIAVFSS